MSDEERDYIKRSEFNQLDKRVGKTERVQERHDEKIQNIEKSLGDIKGNTNKIIWLIVSAIIMAVLNLVLKGGIF